MDLPRFRFRAAAAAAAFLIVPLCLGPAYTAALLAALAALAAAALTAASLAAGGGVPRTRESIALAALDLLVHARALCAAARGRLGAHLVMRGDPLGWERALHPLRGRPILCAGRPVRAFRVVAAGPDPRARPAAAWLYATCPEPGKEDWQRCAGLYSGGGPDPPAGERDPPAGERDPPAHVLDLYSDGEAALGVGVAVRLRDRGGPPMERDLAIRRDGQETAVITAESVPLGGYCSEALIRAALAEYSPK